MRIMTKNGNELKVYAHIVLKNMWEYYVTVLPDANGIGEALVMGVETELGSYSVDEIKPYVISKITNLEEILPAEGWQWKE